MSTVMRDTFRVKKLVLESQNGDLVLDVRSGKVIWIGISEYVNVDIYAQSRGSVELSPSEKSLVETYFSSLYRANVVIAWRDSKQGSTTRKMTIDLGAKSVTVNFMPVRLLTCSSQGVASNEVAHLASLAPGSIHLEPQELRALETELRGHFSSFACDW